MVLDEMPYLISTDAGFEGTLVVPPLSPADAAELLGLSPPDAFDAYTVADSHLRFWLAFLGPHQPEIERRRGDLVAAPISNQFLGSPKVIGSYWTRTNDPQVDLICADRGPVAKRIAFVGLVKWCDSQPFDERDLASMPNWRRRP